jgi:hypothetical protein
MGLKLSAAFLLLALAGSAYGQSMATLCKLTTDLRPDEEKLVTIVPLKPDKSGELSKAKGDDKSPIGTVPLSSSLDLTASLDPSGDISKFYVGGVGVPIETLLDPGISAQMSERHFKHDFIRNVIRMKATKAPDGSYALSLVTIKSASKFGDGDTRNDTWTLSKDASGKWGISANGVRARAIKANLTPKDKDDTTKGFKGITSYNFIPEGQEIPIAGVLPHSTDPTLWSSEKVGVIDDGGKPVIEPGQPGAVGTELVP